MKRIIFFSSIVCSLTACKKIITPNLDNATPQVVIKGAISDTTGPYYVSISRSVGFYSNNTFPPVSGAVITITNVSSGTNDTLSESAPGTYVTHVIQGIPGNTYLLKVLLEGKVYTALSTMPLPVALDSVSFDVSDTTQIRPQANFQDPAGKINFYKYSLTINGVYDKRIQTFEDRLSDGRYIKD